MLNKNSLAVCSQMVERFALWTTQYSQYKIALSILHFKFCPLIAYRVIVTISIVHFHYAILLKIKQGYSSQKGGFIAT